MQLCLFIFSFALALSVMPSAVCAQDVANEIHTVLPKDAIPAIFAPEFVSAGDADVHKDAPMIAVSINGDHRAYSMYMLNRHEIVNDVVGGQAIATTW